MMRKEKKRKGRETHKRKHSDRYEHSFYLGLLSWPSFLSLTAASVYISHSSGLWTGQRPNNSYTHTRTYICCTVYTSIDRWHFPLLFPSSQRHSARPRQGINIQRTNSFNSILNYDFIFSWDKTLRFHRIKLLGTYYFILSWPLASLFFNPECVMKGWRQFTRSIHISSPAVVAMYGRSTLLATPL